MTTITKSTTGTKTRSTAETKFGYEYAIQRLTDDVKELRELFKKQAEATNKLAGVTTLFVTLLATMADGDPAAEKALEQMNDLLK